MVKQKLISRITFLRKFKSMQMVHFATIDGKKPRVRPVTLLKIKGKLWIATGTKDSKIKHLKDNKNIEFCQLLLKGENMGYIRGRGVVKIVKDKKTRVVIAKKIPFFKMFWQDLNDPAYSLLEIILKDADYMRPGKMIPEKIKL
ncbi:pyridoxamine 5'-phosphate oxidase family protein [Candidatus Dependentiae bacterium]|nr:pyridoxamine 5'-phosphate oxidase family protein [Candidatus Dependentiae bacterium]